MNNDLIEEITDSFARSDYSMCAPGMRFVPFWEVFEVIKIIRNSDISDIFNELKELHKYRPETIEIDKSYREHNCENFNNLVCDCFLPDVEWETCYCKRQRQKYLEKTDYRNTPEYKNWRTSVFERDGFTCQDCGVTGFKLNAHHKKTYKKHPKLRFDINNGTTLCIECHRIVHKKRTPSKTGV